MATSHTSTDHQKNDRERLADASLEGCYLKSLLTVLEGIFEDIDSICDDSPEVAAVVRGKARLGLDITYMAQEKASSINGLTDDVEKELWLAERRRRVDQTAGRA